MTSTFNIVRLVNERALVSGTDKFGSVGQTVVSTHQWDEIASRNDFNQAQVAFDQAVEEFFAPLNQAMDTLTSSMTKPTDSLSYIVLEEPTEGVSPKPGHLVRLDKDSIVLRLLEVGDTDRLVWVGGELEILDADAQTTQQVRDALAADTLAHVTEGDEDAPKS